MVKKAEMSEVKFKVRHYALLLREFRVADMVKVTGLNPESIRTELQRMRQDGLLISDRLAEKRRGRSLLYKLTPDPEKRLALSREVESFFPKPPKIFPPRPTSRHYHVANQLIERVAKGYYKTEEEQKTALQEAKQHLKFVEYEEDMSEKLIYAYVNLGRARLEFLSENYEEAETLFIRVRETFTAAELGYEVPMIDEYLAFIQYHWHCEREIAFTFSEKSHCILETLKNFKQLSDRPVVKLLSNLLGEKSKSLEEQMFDTYNEQKNQAIMIKRVESLPTELYPVYVLGIRWGGRGYPVQPAPDASWGWVRELPLIALPNQRKP